MENRPKLRPKVSVWHSMVSRLPADRFFWYALLLVPALAILMMACGGGGGGGGGS